MSGRSAHEQMTEEHFSKLLRDEPEWAKQMAIVRNRIRDGFYDRGFVDACFQKWKDEEPTLAEVYQFAQLYVHYLCGELCTFQVPLESGPGGDRCVDGNQSILNGLPSPFRAHFQGGPGDNDGQFEWLEELGLTRVFLQPDDSERQEKWWCEPRKLSLEVGYTAVSTTFMHVFAEGGVARWPYKHRKLTVLVAHPSFRERRRGAFLLVSKSGTSRV